MHFRLFARFEQTMSMELLDAGIEVAYLPDVTFQHTGTNSAYIANAMPRPWDRPAVNRWYSPS